MKTVKQLLSLSTVNKGPKAVTKFICNKANQCKPILTSSKFLGQFFEIKSCLPFKYN